MSPERQYRSFLARDRAADGKFLAAVLTTGIYCLPSCPARRPKRENVRFFGTPDEARRNGFRPCRRCRPDWLYRGETWHENSYEQIANRVRSAPAEFPDVQAISRAAGFSRTALNDLFREHAHESPGAFLRRVRIQRACEVLESGDKPARAMAEAGFESASSFHEQFLRHTGLTPGAYASLASADQFVLRLPPGYRFNEVRAFFGRDPESASERVSDNGLLKAVLIDGKPAAVEIRLEQGAAQCKLSGGNPFEAHRAAIRMLGIDCDAAAFERQFATDPLIGWVIQRQRGLRIPLTPEPWEALAWAVVGQQISVRAAVVLRRNLILRYGALDDKTGLRAHPAPETIASLNAGDLTALKFSRSKAEYLIEAAKAIASETVPLYKLRDLSARYAARLLSGIRGIGPWTVQYVFLRGLGFADCLPAGDAGLARGLESLSGNRPTETRVGEIMAPFAPYRSLATYHVWASLKGIHE